MDFDDLDVKLPIGLQDFAAIRHYGMVYVDKTRFVYWLAMQPRPLIITRPRRFGKSTLQSTLEELFLHGVAPYDGHDSYFKGLAIEQLWQDQGQYLVLHLDLYELNSPCTTVAEFERNLMDAIVQFCQAHELKVPEAPSSFWSLFQAVLDQVPMKSLVLLVDEYDAPVVNYADNERELAAGKTLLRSLFSSVKSNSGKFRCVFFTGITRYQDLDIGAAGNSFTDLTNDEDFAACCGYTRDEIKQYFADYLRYAASVRTGCMPEEVSAEQIESLLDEMSVWYDGYSFDGSPHNKVFSTWSVLRFFSNSQAIIDQYWSLEESFSMIEFLKRVVARSDLTELLSALTGDDDDILDGKDCFVWSSPVNPEADPYSVLYQFGYLTLCQPFSSSQLVHLHCPNKEIHLAFGKLIARQLFSHTAFYATESIWKALDTLSSHDPDKLLAHFRDLFNAVPYDHLAIDCESLVSALITFHLITLGLKPRLEAINNKGRADCIFDIPDHDLTIVFEYKYEESDNPAIWDADLEKAIAQIKTRDYGNNATSMRTVARFALIYCAHPSQRTIVRVGQESVFNRY